MSTTPFSQENDRLVKAVHGLSNTEITLIARESGLSDDAQRYSTADVEMKIEKAVHDGALQPSVLGYFAANPLRALAGIPHDVAKSYGLPILSEPPRFPLEEIGLKLERAINAGKLPANFLGELQRNTAWVLENIPAAIAKSYGIPRSI